MPNRTILLWLLRRN